MSIIHNELNKLGIACESILVMCYPLCRRKLKLSVYGGCYEDNAN